MGCVVQIFQKYMIIFLTASYGKQTVMNTLIKQLTQVEGFLTICCISYFSSLLSTGRILNCLQAICFSLKILLDFCCQPHLAKPMVPSSGVES